MNAFCCISPNSLFPSSLSLPFTSVLSTSWTVFPLSAWQANLFPQQACCWWLSEVPILASVICMLHRHPLIYFLNTYISHVILHQPGREGAEETKQLIHPRALRKPALEPESSSRLSIFKPRLYHSLHLIHRKEEDANSDILKLCLTTLY